MGPCMFLSTCESVSLGECELCEGTTAPSVGTHMGTNLRKRVLKRKLTLAGSAKSSKGEPSAEEKCVLVNPVLSHLVMSYYLGPHGL